MTIHDPVDGVVLVEVNRPPGNLFTIDLCKRLVSLLESPAEGVHVLRLRAVGEAFCLGREREGATAAELRAESQVLVDVMRALRRTRLVTVCEVQGDAAGFGVGLVAACNVSVAVSSARFSFPEVGIGLAPALVLAWLPRVVGEREAFWLTATGEAVSAARAVELGLVNATAGSPEELVAEVDDRIAALRARSPRVHADIRDMLRVFAEVGDDAALDVSIDRLVVGSMRRGEG
ncbi:enoyl-CoA hydratase/isomerase family protein [Nocardioides mesophilus]|uniref:Enoyl-CoA hydratase/isomerase family protein n=2 Tax=Nocardioides mesophilus TaxID=433659 RepID=A0A7G9RH84_9ACTN|nr:enoyl-CoA hydratase/isomerase family protein [Nocardioides mesophilus]